MINLDKKRPNIGRNALVRLNQTVSEAGEHTKPNSQPYSLVRQESRQRVNKNLNFHEHILNNYRYEVNRINLFQSLESSDSIDEK